MLAAAAFAAPAGAAPRKRAVTATLTITPQDPQTGAPGVNTKLVVHLAK